MTSIADERDRTVDGKEAQQRVEGSDKVAPPQEHVTALLECDQLLMIALSERKARSSSRIATHSSSNIDSCAR